MALQNIVIKNILVSRFFFSHRQPKKPKKKILILKNKNSKNTIMQFITLIFLAENVLFFTSPCSHLF